jgi:hypothetical protein
MIIFLILFLVLLLLAYLTNYFLVRSFLGYRWRIFVAPGVILHELSHAFACVITGAKISNISFFDKDGGSVKYRKSPIPWIPQIIISLAPLVVSIILFYFLGKMIHLESSIDLNSTFFNLKSIIHNINFSHWQNIIIVYLLLSVVVTMTPSWQDFVNMFVPLIVVAIVMFLIFHFSSLNIYSFGFVADRLLPIINLAIFILSGCFIISLIFYILTKLIFKR